MDMRAYIYEGLKLFEAFFYFIQDRIAFVILTDHARILLA